VQKVLSRDDATNLYAVLAADEGMTGGTRCEQQQPQRCGVNREHPAGMSQ